MEVDSIDTAHLSVDHTPVMRCR